jgi:hypothetical protein
MKETVRIVKLGDPARPEYVVSFAINGVSGARRLRHVQGEEALRRFLVGVAPEFLRQAIEDLRTKGATTIQLV